jgi:hypothetical protein
MAEWECELQAHALEVHRQLLAARADPDVYCSTLLGLEDAHAAFTLFPPCQWWSGLGDADGEP